MNDILRRRCIGQVGGAALALAVAVGSAAAQQVQFRPYYGKNKVQYDHPSWHVYRAPHFEVYYYPEFEQHLGRVVSYAESAYERVSNELKHEISFPIPLILYKTFSEFSQTNLFPSEVPEGVLAFAEPVRDRMVLPIDEPPDKLQELIIHELTHIFEFDIIPRSLVRRSVPLWIDEGLADYMTGTWDTLDLMTIRDAAVTDEIPTLEDLNLAYSRAPYNFGHAIFEFMEERFGKEGVRQFLFSLRRAVVGGVGSDVYEQSFRMSPDEFDRQFQKWLKERFKPYRDKEIPTDYSRDYAPDPRRQGKWVAALTASPSPSRELVAVLSYNRRDAELDVVLISGRDGSVIRNLTPGYSGDFEYIPLVGQDAFLGSAIAWTADGQQVAFFGRYQKRRALVMVNVLTAEVERRYEMQLDRAAFPNFSPDGKYVYFSALQEGVGDIFRMDLATEEVVNITQDEFADKFPVVDPEGEWLYYSRRISGHDKLYRLPLNDPSKKEQLTFGPFDDAAPTFSLDGRLLFHVSNEDDNIFNLRSLNLETGDIVQYTDTMGGNFAPAVVLDESDNEQLLFSSYYKGEYGLYRLSLEEPVKEIAADQIIRTEGPVIDFVPPVLHQVIPENKRRKGQFEKLYVAGAPPVAVGVNSDGSFYGGTGIAFTDVLGDQNFNFFALSVREFRNYSGNWTNLGHRLQYALTGFHTTSFFYTNPFIIGQPVNLFSRQGEIATLTQSGGAFTGIYPIDRFKRLEFRTGIIRQDTNFRNPFLDPDINIDGIGFDPAVFEAFKARVEERFPNGTILPIGVAFVTETTRFRNFGPLAGSTMMLSATVSPGGPFLARSTFQADLRKYLQMTGSSLVALRLVGFHSTGDNPDFFWFGGDNSMRGYPFQGFVGNRGFYGNAEVRFPLVDALLTPVGFFGPLRGTFFANMGGAAYSDEPFQIFASDLRISRVDGRLVDGWGTKDAVASYGFSLGLNLFGLPMHFDWVKVTDFADPVSERLSLRNETQFKFWIGYDY
ncbi:MAG TPA: hypothetical protein VGC53_06580 [Vicinamibacteria bacterium]